MNLAPTRSSLATVLEAGLFGWMGALARVEWGGELLPAGHRAGLAALGRAGEATQFTARFRAERLAALTADGAAGRLDYGAELRDLLGPLTGNELDRFLDAEHAAWRPARSLLDSAH